MILLLLQMISFNLNAVDVISKKVFKCFVQIIDKSLFTVKAGRTGRPQII